MCKFECDETPKIVLTIHCIWKRQSDIEIHVLVAVWKYRNTSEIKRHQQIHRESAPSYTWKAVPKKAVS